MGFFVGKLLLNCECLFAVCFSRFLQITGILPPLLGDVSKTKYPWQFMDASSVDFLCLLFHS